MGNTHSQPFVFGSSDSLRSLNCASGKEQRTETVLDKPQDDVSKMQRVISRIPRLHQFVSQRSLDGENSLHWAIKHNELDLLQTILSSLRDKKLLTEPNLNGKTLLQYAITKRSLSAVRLILGALNSSEEKKWAIVYQDPDGNNSLHIAMTSGCEYELVHTLLHNVATKPERQSVIITTNNKDKNVIQLGLDNITHDRINLLLLEELSNEQLLRVMDCIPSHRVKNLLPLAVAKDDIRLLTGIVDNFPDTVREWTADDSLQTLPLSCEELALFEPFCDTVIIPQDQSRAKRIALICYSPSERDGAMEEAMLLKRSLEACHFEVRVHSWTQFAEMREWIVYQTDEIKNQCSILALALMSHGVAGGLQGDADSVGEITNIIDETRRAIPTHIPIMTIVQACQGRARLNVIAQSTSEEDAARVPDEELGHVILRADNCVLMMATVYEGKAYRNHFTSALGQELRERDGNKSIFDIFTKASKTMRSHTNSEYCQQRPEFRSTLRNILIL